MFGKAGFNVYKKCYDAGEHKTNRRCAYNAPPFICEKRDIDELLKMRLVFLTILNHKLRIIHFG